MEERLCFFIEGLLKVCNCLYVKPYLRFFIRKDQQFFSRVADSTSICVQSGPNIIQSTQNWEEGNTEELPEPKLAGESRRSHSRGNNNDKIRRQGSLPAAYSEGRDLEAPMPPSTLAPVPEYDITR